MVKFNITFSNNYYEKDLNNSKEPRTQDDKSFKLYEEYPKKVKYYK